MRPVRGSGDRAQAIQLGALLLFAILIINLSLYQVFVVPDQNGEIEFKHNEQVRDQLVDYRTSVIRASGGGSEEAATVTLGPPYPSRTLFVNPASPSGSLRSVGTDDSAVNATLDNVRPLDAEARDFWDGTPRNYSTGGFQYRPGYNYYDNAPTTVYDNSVVYDDFGDEQLARTDQRLVSGRQISLIALQGSYQQSGTGSESVSAFPASASDTRVTVENATGENLSVAVPTRLSERRWIELLEGEFDNNNAPADPTTCDDLDGANDPNETDDRYVVNCDYTPPASGEEFGTIRLWFENGTYDLRLSKVTFGSDESTAFGYVTRVDGHNESVSESSTLQIVAETRDEFNNPSSGVDLIAETGSGTQGTVSPSSRVTDSDGRAAFTFDPADDGDATVVVCRDDGNGNCVAGSRNKSKFSIDVTAGSGNQDPSVTVNDATYSNPDKELTVSFTPKDADGNLDTATIADGDGNQITSSPIDISGREGDTITRTFTVNNNNKPDFVEVTVTDTDDATGSDTEMVS